MFIRRLTLENFGPFRGQHAVDLDCGTIAVVGSEDDDPTRSNGTGKSTLLDAITWCLFGKSRKAFGDLVTTGETCALVRLELSTGLVITREIRDGRGSVSVTGAEDARSRDAAEYVAEQIGFDADELLATAVLSQGDAGRLAEAGPAERRDLLRVWCVPEVWDRYAKLAIGAHGEKRAALEVKRASRAAIVSPDLDVIAAELKAAREERAAVPPRKVDATAIREADTTLRAWTARLRRQHEIARAEAALDEVVVAQPLAECENIETTCREQLALGRKRVAELRTLASGRFDGPCPVDGVACPRAQDIRDAKAEHAKRLATGEEWVRTREGAHRTADGALRTARDTQRRREELEKLALTPDSPEMTGDVGAARAVLRAAAEPVIDTAALDRRIGMLDAQLTRARQDADRMKVLELECELLEREVLMFAWLARACGRDGIPAQIVDSAASEIAALGSAAIEAAGSSLRLEVRTSEPLKKLASSCVCGREFAAREKTCPVCRTARGNATAPDLSFLVAKNGGPQRPLAQRSSGERMLAALALRLGAAAWRRRNVGAAWGVLTLDEVEGPLDAANAEVVGALASQGASTLGFEQVFLVSHRPSSSVAAGRILRVTMRDGDSEVA